MFRQLLRRFLLPQVLLIVLPTLVVAIVALALLARAYAGQELVQRSIALLWAGGFACVAAAALSVLLGYRFLKSHVTETAEMLHGAVPAAVAAAKASPRSAATADVLFDVARTFSQLMDEASKNQAQLRTIISSMSDGLIATDHQQRILLTNESAQELMAFRTPVVQGKQLWEVVPLEQVLKAVTEVSLTGQRKTVSVGPVNGRYLDVTVTRLPLRPSGFIIVAHDVTEAMRYEELRKEFVANVSHELRTPLTVIKGYVETLKDGALDDRARAVQYLETVEHHAEQLTNLVDDLLSLSRLDSRSAVPSPRPVHLGRVAGKVVELMSPAAQKKGHKLVLEVDDGLRPVVGNAEYLERAIANLVENAIKYTAAGGSIRVRVRGDTRQTVVEVQDNGIGISPEDLPRIFERFYRAERSRSREMGGTGLGLSIVKHVVQVHQGQVEVQSTPGEGSLFRLTFPASPGAETDAGGAAA